MNEEAKKWISRGLKIGGAIFIANKMVACVPIDGKQPIVQTGSESKSIETVTVGYKTTLTATEVVARSQTPVKENLEVINNATVIDFGVPGMINTYESQLGKEFIDEQKALIQQSLDLGWKDQGLTPEKVKAQEVIIPGKGAVIFGDINNQTYLLQIINLASKKRYGYNSQLNYVTVDGKISYVTTTVKGIEYMIAQVTKGTDGIYGVKVSLQDGVNVFVSNGSLDFNGQGGIKIAALAKVTSDVTATPEISPTSIPTLRVDPAVTPTLAATFTRVPTETLTPTGTKEAIGLTESKYFKLDFVDKRVIEYKGLSIPMTVGLTKSMIERPAEPVKGYEVKDGSQFVNIMESFLKACWLRYNAENKTSYSFDNYLDLLKKGQGSITVFGNDEKASNNMKKFQDLKIDPRDGFVKIFDATELPVMLDYYRYYAGKNADNALVIATNSIDFTSLDQLHKSTNPNKNLGLSMFFTMKILTGFQIAIVDVDKELVQARLDGKLLRQFSANKETGSTIVVPYVKKMFDGLTDSNLWLVIKQ